MDSFFDSLIPLLILLFYLFSGFTRKKQEEQPTAKEPSYPQPEDEPPTLREEIRRRFQERARETEGESEFFEPSTTLEEPKSESFVEEEEHLFPQQEKIDALGRKAADIKMAAERLATPTPNRKLRSINLSNLRERLRNPESLREAIVLMEVLGTPISLRRPHEGQGTG